MELFGSNFNLFRSVRKREATPTPGVPSSTMPPEPEVKGGSYQERIVSARHPRVALTVSAVYRAVELRATPFSSSASRL